MTDDLPRTELLARAMLVVDNKMREDSGHTRTAAASAERPSHRENERARR